MSGNINGDRPPLLPLHQEQQADRVGGTPFNFFDVEAEAAEDKGKAADQGAPPSIPDNQASQVLRGGPRAQHFNHNLAPLTMSDNARPFTVTANEDRLLSQNNQSTVRIGNQNGDMGVDNNHGTVVVTNNDSNLHVRGNAGNVTVETNAGSMTSSNAAAGAVEEVKQNLGSMTIHDSQARHKIGSLTGQLTLGASMTPARPAVMHQPHTSPRLSIAAGPEQAHVPHTSERPSIPGRPAVPAAPARPGLTGSGRVYIADQSHEVVQYGPNFPANGKTYPARPGKDLVLDQNGKVSKWTDMSAGEKWNKFGDQAIRYANTQAIPLGLLSAAVGVAGVQHAFAGSGTQTGVGSANTTSTHLPTATAHDAAAAVRWTTPPNVPQVQTSFPTASLSHDALGIPGTTPGETARPTTSNNPSDPHTISTHGPRKG